MADRNPRRKASEKDELGRGIAPRGAAGEWETPPGKVRVVLPTHTLY